VRGEGRGQVLAPGLRQPPPPAQVRGADHQQGNASGHPKQPAPCFSPPRLRRRKQQPGRARRHAQRSSASRLPRTTSPSAPAQWCRQQEQREGAREEQRSVGEPADVSDVCPLRVSRVPCHLCPRWVRWHLPSSDLSPLSRLGPLSSPHHVVSPRLSSSPHHRLSSAQVVSWQVHPPRSQIP
jgi:hypothetical protein